MKLSRHEKTPLLFLLFLLLVSVFFLDVNNNVSAVAWPTHDCYPDEALVWCPTPDFGLTKTMEPYPGIDARIQKAEPIDTPVPARLTIPRPNRRSTK